MSEIELSSVIIGEGQGAMIYVAGGTSSQSKGCNRIFMSNDGRGPMGLYDRINIMFTDGRHKITPAHFCLEWELV